MLSYLDQIRRARSWRQQIEEVLRESETAIRQARESWSVLPDDVEEIDLWCRELEATCLGLRAILAEVRSAARAHPSSPLPHPTLGRGHMTSPHPQSPGVA